MSRRNRIFLVLMVAFLAVSAFILFGDNLSFAALQANREELLAFRDNNFWGLVASFVLIYLAVVTFSLPGATVASVAGGFLFGQGFGTTLNVLSATAGACMLFGVVRVGFGDFWVAKVHTASDRIKRLDARLRNNEVSVLLLLRLVPAVPFVLANLLPAIVGVSFFRFFWTTAVGIIPAALIYTAIGAGLGEVFDHGQEPDFGLLREPQVVFPIIGLCVLISLPLLIDLFSNRSES